MIMSWLLLIATMSLMAFATRLNSGDVLGFGAIPSTRTALTMHQVPMIHPQVNLPHPRMFLPPPSDDDYEYDHKVTELCSTVTLPTPCEANINDTWILQQSVPPLMIFRMQPRQLLHNWAMIRRLRQLGTSSYWPDDKAIVLENMLDIIDMPTDTADVRRFHRAPNSLHTSPNSKVEIVSLIQNVFLETPMAPCREALAKPNVVNVSVLALGAFSREKVMDDHQGSLRNHIQEQYEKKAARIWWGHDTKQFDVFAIEGLVDAGGCTRSSRDFSARVLLSKMKQYADQEQKIVVLPKRTYISSDGTDLTEYYVRIGFEKVEMNDGLHELVYTGTSSSEAEISVEKQQIMVACTFGQALDGASWQPTHLLYLADIFGLDTTRRLRASLTGRWSWPVFF